VRWVKVVAAVLGVMIVFLIVSSVVGFLVEAVIAVLAVGAIVLGVKAASSRRKRISSKAPNRKIRGPSYDGPRRRDNTADVEDDLERLKRETRG
jgi:hypothetical protein